MPTGHNLVLSEFKLEAEKSIPSMSDEQKTLFDELTPLQGKVAINTISGMNALDSYKAAGGKAKSDNTKSASVSEILSNPKVKAFLASMNEAAVSNAVMSRQEMLERLSNLSRVNMTDLLTWSSKEGTEEGEIQSMWTIKDSAEQDPYAMASIAEVTSGRDGIKIKQHSPLAAMKQLAELAGYLSEDQNNKNEQITKVQIEVVGAS